MVYDTVIFVLTYLKYRQVGQTMSNKVFGLMIRDGKYRTALLQGTVINSSWLCRMHLLWVSMREIAMKLLSITTHQTLSRSMVSSSVRPSSKWYRSIRNTID